LQSEITEVRIQSNAPIIIIGEKINPTGNKRLAKALQTSNYEYIRTLAAELVAAGADVLDINVSAHGLDDTVLLPEVVKVLASRVSVPLCIDSPNPKAMAAALAVAPGKPLANSVNGQGSVLREMLPIVKDRGAAVIGLTLDDKGIPNKPYERLAIAGRILEQAVRIGIPSDDVIIDPLVMPVGADQKAGKVTLETIELIRRELGVNIILGASNVSFGLPSRNTINQAFLALAVAAGANCVITDPIQFTAFIRATDLLRGHDPYAKRYISYYRSHPRMTREEASPRNDLPKACSNIKSQETF